MQLFSCFSRDESFTVTVKGKPVLAGICKTKEASE
jgi:hypothetical protein